MELWIRAQSKKGLLKIEDIYYEESGSKYVIVGNNHCLGYYSTEQQALEVLDEIQNQLLKVMTINNPQELHFLRKDSLVYQMPEDKGEKE